MPKGHSWTLTRKRKREAMKLFAEKQYTLRSAALEMGIDWRVLRKRLEEEGIDYKELRNKGRVALRASLFTSIMNIEDEAKRVDLGLKYLDRYPVDEHMDDEGVSTKAVDEAVNKVISELTFDIKVREE